MQKREMKVTIGDWSDDGHGKTEVINILFKGTIVDNAILQSTYDNNLNRTQVNPFDFCTGYEKNTMSKSDWEKIISKGFDPDFYNDDMTTPVYNVEDEFYMYPFIALLMWYVTHGTDITWSIVEYDELISGYNPSIKSSSNSLPGYGLFY